jgi:hypothetical protein
VKEMREMIENTSVAVGMFYDGEWKTDKMEG